MTNNTNFVILTTKVLAFIFIIINTIRPVCGGQYLESPCPNVFQYKFDDTQTLYGVIQVESPSDMTVEINVEMSVGNKVEGFKGSIELASSKEQTVQDIMERRPIVYNVRFPYWYGTEPKITQINLNGHLICTGPKTEVHYGQILSTVQLQHVLRIKLSSLSSSSPENKNDFSSRDNFNNQYSFSSPGNFKNPYKFSPPGPDNYMNPYELFKDVWINGTRYKNPYGLSPSENTNSKNPYGFLTGPSKKNVPSTISGNNNNFQITGSNQGGQFQNGFVPERTTQSSFDKRIISTPPSRPSVQRINNDVCGVPVATNTLVVNGDPVPKGAYPWLVAMYEAQSRGLTYICCGSLISTKHVVTAAHCVAEKKLYQPKDIVLRLGKLNIRDWIPDPEERMIVPESIHVHSEYQKMTAIGDIAVIVMRDEVQFTKFIRPICLWTGSDDLNRVVGLDGVVAGWGKDENGVPNTAEPKQVTLPIVSQEQCLRSAYQFRDITSDKTFCAGTGRGNGPCNGDSGSGFVMYRNGRWVLRGIVSMSVYTAKLVSCDLSNYIVFADASKYKDWLYSFLK